MDWPLPLHSRLCASLLPDWLNRHRGYFISAYLLLQHNFIHCVVENNINNDIYFVLSVWISFIRDSAYPYANWEIQSVALSIKVLLNLEWLLTVLGEETKRDIRLWNLQWANWHAASLTHFWSGPPICFVAPLKVRKIDCILNRSQTSDFDSASAMQLQIGCAFQLCEFWQFSGSTLICGS